MSSPFSFFSTIDSFINKLTRTSNFIGRTSVSRTALYATVVFYFPEIFKWVTPHIPLFLGIITPGMGLMLTPPDFEIISRHPKAVVIGVVSQFVIMSLTAYSLAMGLSLPAEVTIGVILIGSCPGGAASSVITCLARGNAALSMAVTSVTTLLAPIMTPLIFWALAHQRLEISAVDMLVSVMRMVLPPIMLGVIAHILFRRQAEKAVDALLLISAIAVVLIIGAVVGASEPKIIENGLLIPGMVVLHNCIDYLLSFLVAKLCKLPYDTQKTPIIEVSMQNFDSGVVLAPAYSTPLMTVPGVPFGVWYNISGPLLASYWASEAKKADPAER